VLKLKACAQTELFKHMPPRVQNRTVHIDCAVKESETNASAGVEIIFEVLVYPVVQSQPRINSIEVQSGGLGGAGFTAIYRVARRRFYRDIFQSHAGEPAVSPW